MRHTTRALNRATLSQQVLLRREVLDIVAAVRRVVALWAQHPAPILKHVLVHAD